VVFREKQMNIFDLYEARCRGDGGAVHRDIIEHLPTLKRLADECESVVEFGVRTGNSTVAFLASKAKRVVSYDLAEIRLVLPNDCADRLTMLRENTAMLRDIPECDLLFIDTLHTYEQVKAELRHAHRVSTYIVFHDTVNYGGRDEGNDQGVGIVSAIFEFLAKSNNWCVWEHHTNNNGLTVLLRLS
jgi:cephalosporin hydroxylase